MKLYTDSLQISKSQQDVYYTEVGELNGNKVKIEIRSNAYKFQSSAVAFVWSEINKCWNRAVELHSSLMATEEALYAKRAAPTSDWFGADRDNLVSHLNFLLT